MFGFRSEATAVMEHGSWSAPLDRMAQLAAIGCITGIVLFLAHFAFQHARRLTRPDPLPWALVATAAVEVLGIVGGANFWPHYLIALIPTLALTAGLAAHRRMPGARTTRRLVVAAVVITAVLSPFQTIQAANDENAAWSTGRWVAASARPTDTLTVTYTHSNAINASGLRPGYPYAWSLPTRTLDPHLHLLIATLGASSVGTPSDPKRLTAPTWVVHWDPSDSWKLDTTGRLHAALRASYRPVAHVCGHTVWLHDGLQRRLAPVPPASAC
jgi:hypothetical protein